MIGTQIHLQIRERPLFPLPLASTVLNVENETLWMKFYVNIHDTIIWIWCQVSLKKFQSIDQFPGQRQCLHIFYPKPKKKKTKKLFKWNYNQFQENSFFVRVKSIYFKISRVLFINFYIPTHTYHSLHQFFGARFRNWQIEIKIVHSISF